PSSPSPSPYTTLFRSDSVFPADTALLVAAHRQFGSEHGAAVHTHIAGAHATSNAECTLLRSARHRTGQAVRGCVGDTHRIVVVRSEEHTSELQSPYDL